MSCSDSVQSSKSAFLARGKSLLINVEQAKKDEWLRRRKIRLQQVRQQSKELAIELIGKVRTEKNVLSNEIDKQYQEQFKLWQKEKIHCLQDQYDQNLNRLGSAHNNALQEIEVNALDQEKQSLLTELAKARGDLAKVKQKREHFERCQEKSSLNKKKEFVKSVENLRSALVSSLPPPTSKPKKTEPVKGPRKVVVSSPRKKKRVDPVEKEIQCPWDQSVLESSDFVTGTVEAVPPSSCINESQQPRVSVYHSPVRCSQDCSLSPSVKGSPNKSHKTRVKFKDSSTCSKVSSHAERYCRGDTKHLSDCESDASFESDVTWPPAIIRPRSSNVNCESFVYDHCSRTCQCLSPSRRNAITVQHQPGCVNDGFEEEIAAMQAKALKKHEEKLRQRRGSRAEFKQRLRSEFSCMLRDLAKVDKTQRLAAVESHALEALSNKTRKSEPKKATSVEFYNTDEIPVRDSEGNSPLVEKACKTDVPAERQIIEHQREKIYVSRESITEEVSTFGTHLTALDELLKKLQAERDLLLACHNTSSESIEINLQQRDCLNQSIGVQVENPQVSEFINGRRDSSSKEPNEKTTSPSVLESKDPVLDLEESEETFPLKIQSDKATSPINMVNALSEKDCSTIYLKETSKKCSPKKTNMVDASTITSAKKNNKNDLPMESRRKPHPTSRSPTSKSLNSPPKRRAESPKMNDSGISPQKSEKRKCTESYVKCSEKAVSSHMVQTDSPSNISNDSNSALIGSASYNLNGLKVEVKVSGKNLKSLTGKDSSDKNKEDFWNQKLCIDKSNSNSSGTSYLSPPEELDPSQQEILCEVLNKIQAKNSNPLLHQYIIKLLSMSKESIDDLGMSVSSVSLSSNLFPADDTKNDNHSKGDNLSEKDKVKNVHDEHVKCSSKSTETYYTPCSSSGDPLINDQVPLRKVFEDSDSNVESLTEKPIPSEVSSAPGVHYAEGKNTSNGNDKLCSELANLFSERLKTLTQMITSSPNSSKKSFPDETSYLSLPSGIEGSVKISDSIKKVNEIPALEETINISDVTPCNSRINNIDDGVSNLSKFNPLGVRLDLLPRPESVSGKNPVLNHQITKGRPKPPSCLLNPNTRYNVLESVSPHELSTITEMESILLSQQKSSLRKPYVTTPRGFTERNLPVPPFDPESQIFKDFENLPSPTESSFLSTPNMSPVKMPTENQQTRANETSLSLISNLSDNSLTQCQKTRKEELEEVFRSLGIGWALSTVRKTNEANKLEGTSSSSGEKEKRERSKGRTKHKHSTPLKGESHAHTSGTVCQHTSSVKSSDSLSAPSVSLYTRYLKLISDDEKQTQNKSKDGSL